MLEMSRCLNRDFVVAKLPVVGGLRSGYLDQRGSGCVTDLGRVTCLADFLYQVLDLTLVNVTVAGESNNLTCCENTSYLTLTAACWDAVTSADWGHQERLYSKYCASAFCVRIKADKVLSSDSCSVTSISRVSCLCTIGACTNFQLPRSLEKNKIHLSRRLVHARSAKSSLSRYYCGLNSVK